MKNKKTWFIRLLAVGLVSASGVALGQGTIDAAASAAMDDIVATHGALIAAAYGLVTAGIVIGLYKSMGRKAR